MYLEGTQHLNLGLNTQRRIMFQEKKLNRLSSRRLQERLRMARIRLKEKKGKQYQQKKANQRNHENLEKTVSLVKINAAEMSRGHVIKRNVDKKQGL